MYYQKEIHTEKFIHWDSAHLEYRLINHFYAFLHFTNSTIDNHYKRLVRDTLHYRDEVFCTAGKIVHALQREAALPSSTPSFFSALHVRRGDLQFKEVKISAEEWYNNSKELWRPNELLYIATDEKNKTWFEPIQKHRPIKFLDDYSEMAGLANVDSVYIGLIETIIASHGRTFVGTWFSTFSNYINRLRGYNGRSMEDSWYSYLPRKSKMHGWEYPNGNYGAREFPIAWVGIDGNEVPKAEQQTLPKEGTFAANTDLASSAEVIRHSVRGLGRGIAGLPMSQTPALDITCDVDVDSLAYWNDPVGLRDEEFQSPFSVEDEDVKYISFSPDRGGWNNIRYVRLRR